MATNARPEFFKAQVKYKEAKTIYEKITALEEMLRLAPDHKSAENLRANLTQKLGKLKKQLEQEKKQKSGRHQISVKKEGAAQIVIIGVTNSGKSTLLSLITNAKPLINDFPYTTKVPEIGIMDYQGIKVQLVEIPGIFQNFINSTKGPLFLGIIRQSDMIIMILKNNPEQELDLLTDELKKSNILLYNQPTTPKFDYYSYKNTIIILNSAMPLNKKKFKVLNIKDQDLIAKIWKSLNLIYVYTKSPGKQKDYPPVALKRNSTVKDLATHIHKEFIKKFQYAKVWGKSSKFHSGQIVGITHILEEGDVVEVHIK